MGLGLAGPPSLVVLGVPLPQVILGCAEPSTSQLHATGPTMASSKYFKLLIYLIYLPYFFQQLHIKIDNLH
jgi:hypothetical protein